MILLTNITRTNLIKNLLRQMGGGGGESILATDFFELKKKNVTRVSQKLNRVFPLGVILAYLQFTNHDDLIKYRTNIKYENQL